MMVDDEAVGRKCQIPLQLIGRRGVDYGHEFIIGKIAILQDLHTQFIGHHSCDAVHSRRCEYVCRRERIREGVCGSQGVHVRISVDQYHLLLSSQYVGRFSCFHDLPSLS